jgi:hypothetical protein
MCRTGFYAFSTSAGHPHRVQVLGTRWNWEPHSRWEASGDVELETLDHLMLGNHPDTCLFRNK